MRRTGDLDMAKRRRPRGVAALPPGRRERRRRRDRRRMMLALAGFAIAALVLMLANGLHPATPAPSGAARTSVAPP
jgi:ferric-dicitrate binding protein FerR (iron transport regulator)